MMAPDTGALSAATFDPGADLLGDLRRAMVGIHRG
jgi:hypothetical protein